MYVKVEGTRNALRALAQFDPELAKEIGKELSAQGRTIANDAKSFLPTESPMRGWRTVPARVPRGRQNRDGSFSTFRESRGGRGWPEWTGNLYRASIKSRRRQFDLTLTSARDPAGMIFEVAGTKGGRGRNSSGSPQGQAFIKKLGEVKESGPGNRSGRAMVRGLKKNYRSALDGLEAATDKTMTTLQRYLDG